MNCSIESDLRSKTNQNIVSVLKQHEMINYTGVTISLNLDSGQLVQIERDFRALLVFD